MVAAAPAGLTTPVLPAIEDLTRREFLSAALAAAALVACGDDSEEATPTPSAREVEDAFGAVALPARPERVVAVRHHHIGNMLALDFIPIGIVPNASEFPLPGQAEALAGVANVRAEADWMLDIEKAMALEPDLIIEMSGQEDDPWNQEICELAKAAAVTTCYPYGYSNEVEIKQNLIDVGEALGLQEQAAELIAAYDARVAELREAAAGFADKPVANIIWTSFANSGFFVPVDRPSNVTLRTLGIPEPAFQADPSVGEVPFSFENLELLNEAYAVIVLLEGEATQADLEASPVWQLLEPVQAGRVVFVDGNIWAWDYLPAMMRMLDDVEEQLLLAR
jgi:iron complex transport system substrate-binding protein